MIKDVNGKFDGYSTSPKIRQILLRWGYELFESDSFFSTIFVHIKMSYYWFNIQELLHKTKGRYQNCGGAEKAAKYYLGNKDFKKEKANNEYKSLSKKENESKKNMEETGIKTIKKQAKNINFMQSIK